MLHQEVTMLQYQQHALRNINNTIGSTDLTELLGSENTVKRVGKVRDCYELQNRIFMVTTDRLSAFDRVLATVPFKGQVLTMVSAWWFNKTQHIVPNHLIAQPDPNVIVAKKCNVFPIEFVVRGYMTGSTSTSIWTNYANGVRDYCGHKLPDGLKKNQKLPCAIVTPTTKETEHDRLISPSEIIAEGLMSSQEWEYCSNKALELFAFGQQEAAKRGLILVDTKYEFGRTADGTIVLVDEIHTPDSSRYWIAESYEERFNAGLAPESVDKDIVRNWFVKHCDPYKDEILPKAPDDLIALLSARYVELYEQITGEKFQFSDENAMQRLRRNLKSFLEQ